MSEAIGSLRVDLATNTKEFVGGLGEARSALASFASDVAKQFGLLEQNIKRVGVGLTAAITAPFAAMTVASGRGASAFQSAMSDVHAALRGIPTKQLEELGKLARTIGPQMGVSAVEAAKGIETLALTGLKADQILRGAAKSTVLLARANDAELTPAAQAITDVMAQFGKTTADLPRIVNTITGALDNSKFGFVDFQQAISQAGGVAGSVGVSFEEFNTAIAATSSLFASGSDAGTSFKTFITSLKPQSEDAARVMKQLGLSFFDAEGNMKGMAEIAGLLREKLAGLSEGSRTEALRKMFGTDAMRTAIGFMGLTREEFEKLQAAIEKTDAMEKLRIQQEGLAPSIERMRAAFEGLKIALGEAGLTALFTRLSEGLAGVARWLSNLPPIVHSVAIALWAVAAAIGPLILAVTTLAAIALPLGFARLGLFGRALALLINPIGVLVNVLGGLLVRMGAVSAAAAIMGTTMMRFAGPIGIVVTALALLAFTMGKAVQASNGAKAATDALSSANAAYEESALAAATATGKARDEALKNAAATREAARQSLADARAKLANAQAALNNARALAVLNAQRMKTAGNDPRLMPGAGKQIAQGLAEQAMADVKALETAISASQKQFDNASRIIDAAASAGSGTIDMSFDKPDKPDKAKKDRTEDLALRREQLRLQQQLDVATARGDIEEERRISRLIDLKQREADYEDAGLSKALAKVAASRDMADLQAARTAGLAVEIDLAKKDMDLQAAQISGDQVFIRMRENELFLHERIQFWRQKELSLQDAQNEAASELAQIEAARLEMQTKLAAERAKERAVQLAELRGDSDRALKKLRYDADLAKRAREIEERDKVNPTVADARARIEMDEEEKAKLQGAFRDTIKGGFHAALNGDFKGWFKNWWTERLTRSLEDALNNVADAFMKLISNAFNQSQQAGGGGILSALGSIVGALGKTSPGPSTHPIVNGVDPLAPLAEFNTGGSFKVGGRSGIDANLIQFRATKGEIVDIKRPGNDNGGSSRIEVIPSPYFEVVVDGVAKRATAPMVAHGVMVAAAGGQQAVARKQRRSIP